MSIEKVFDRLVEESQKKKKIVSEASFGQFPNLTKLNVNQIEYLVSQYDESNEVEILNARFVKSKMSSVNGVEFIYKVRILHEPHEDEMQGIVAVFVEFNGNINAEFRED